MEQKNTSRSSFRVTLRRLYALAKPERRAIGWGIFFLTIASAMNLAFPQAIRFIIDEALGGRNQANIDRAALVMAAVFLVQGVAIAGRYVAFSRAGERVVARLRGDVLAAMLQQEIGFFDTQKTGELTNRLSADATVLQGTVAGYISMALRNTAAVIGGVTLLFVTSVKLSLLMLSIVPPVALGAVAYGRKVRQLSKDAQDSLAKANNVAEEALSGIRTVRSFAAEAAEVSRYKRAIDDFLAISFRRIHMAATFLGAASFASYFAGAVVFWYGGRLVVAGEVSVGQLTSFLVYTMLVAFSLGALSDVWAEYNRATGAAERIFELLERPSQIPNDRGDVLERVQGALEFERVDFAYPTRADVPVLQSFGLQLNPGEVVALVGPSGAGKSTVASLLYRLYDPIGGRILLDGRPLTELNPTWLRQQIGVVAQEPLLFSATIAENIRYGRRDATDSELQIAAAQAHVHDFAHKFPQGYQTLVGERGVQLSGGQKQRVAIARAILKNPRVLILDEATSALDAENEHLVKEALDRLMAGRTTLVIAHRLSTVKGAHRVVVLDHGRVSQIGTHAELLATEGVYRRLVERQFAA